MKCDAEKSWKIIVSKKMETGSGGSRVNRDNCPDLTHGELPKFDIKEAESICAGMFLNTLMVGGYMVVTNSEFDVVVSDEPYVALMLLVSLKSGRFFARVWNQTITTGKVLSIEEVAETCRNLFGNGRPCLGKPQSELQREEGEFLILNAPFQRIVSRNCLKFLGRHATDGSDMCRECMRLNDIVVKAEIKGETMDTDEEAAPVVTATDLMKEEVKNEDEVAPISENLIAKESEEPVEYHFRYVDSDAHKKGIRKEFKCNHCPYTSLVIQHMKRHIKRVHKKIRDQECDECNYAATDKWILSQHKQNVHKVNDKKFKCETCSYTTSKKYHLKIHVEGVHNKVRNHICEECGLRVLQKAYLRQHMESVHKKGEKFQCEQCPFSAYRKTSLKLHIEGVHEKTNTYSCEKCPFTSYHKNGLNKHVNEVHKKIRNHFCEHCGKSFLNKGSLRRHIETVHKIGGREFRCDQCPFTSTHKESLKTHIKGVHDKLKSNLCHICGYVASTKITLKNHMESAH